MKGAIVDKYKKIDNYKVLNEKNVEELKNIIAPLITYTEEEELSKRFDYQMYVIENAYLGKKSFLKAKNIPPKAVYFCNNFLQHFPV